MCSMVYECVLCMCVDVAVRMVGSRAVDCYWHVSVVTIVLLAQMFLVGRDNYPGVFVICSLDCGKLQNQ